MQQVIIEHHTCEHVSSRFAHQCKNYSIPVQLLQEDLLQNNINAALEIDQNRGSEMLSEPLQATPLIPAHLHLTPTPHRVWLSGGKTRTSLQNLRVNVENEAENMEQPQDQDIRLVSLSAFKWVVLKLRHRFGPVDSMTVSVCNIGVGFCGDRDSCS